MSAAEKALDAVDARVAALKHDRGSWHADPLCGIVWGGPGTINDGRICDIRGWGHLTGGGALNLHPDEAARVQDARKEFIARARTDVPMLAAVVRAAIARPWWSDRYQDERGHQIERCECCHASRKNDLDPQPHRDWCQVKDLDAALDAFEAAAK